MQVCVTSMREICRGGLVDGKTLIARVVTSYWSNATAILFGRSKLPPMVIAHRARRASPEFGVKPVRRRRGQRPHRCPIFTILFLFFFGGCGGRSHMKESLP